MPQYQKQKKGQARIRIVPQDSTRGYLLMMRQQGGHKLQVLADDVYVVDESLLTILTENQITFEILEQK